MVFVKPRDLIIAGAVSVGLFSAAFLAGMYSQFRGISSKIEARHPEVRGVAVSIAKQHSGSLNLNQIVDLYEWTKTNIKYVDDPLTREEYIAKSSETLRVGAGDCDDQAVLISGLMRAIGADSRIVMNPRCKHAYSLVNVCDEEKEIGAINKSIKRIYLEKYHKKIGEIAYYTRKGKCWLVVDPAGGKYLGDLAAPCINEPIMFFEIIE